MQRALLGVLAILFTMSQVVTFSQSSVPPKAAIDITDEEVKAVLAHQPPSTDRQFRVVNFTYLSVRPDPKKVLQTGYVHPAIAAMKKSSPR